MTRKKKETKTVVYYYFFGHDLSNDAHKNYSYTEVQAIPEAGMLKQHPKAKLELATLTFSS